MKNVNKNLPCVLSIAGTDPTGGAGIQADIKTISATGCYAASVITALVAQNTQGVQSVYPISADFVKEQFEAVFSDMNIKAVKIGMLYSRPIIETVSSIIKNYCPRYVIVDPVIVSKNGYALIDNKTFDYLTTELFFLTSLITPNLAEAEKISNTKIISLSDMESVAKGLSHRFKTNILIKGGHLQGEESTDVLYEFKNKTFMWFCSQKINTQNTHGTGCTLSSAIASYLAQGYTLKNAISLAKNYLTHSISAAKNLKIGKGFGPLDHFYFLR